MKLSILLLSGSALALALFRAASGQDMLSSSRFAFGVGAGTTGGLVEGSYSLSPQFVLRGQGAFIDFSEGFKSDGIKYSGKLHFNTGGGFVDFHPFSNAWLFSVGGVGGERKVDLAARPSVSGVIKIDGVSYPVTEIGQLSGMANFGDPAPFVGLGWDNTFLHSHGIGFKAVAGVIFGGTPNVDLHAEGPFAANPLVASEVQSEQASLAHDIHDYQYYPVVQLGLNYRF